MSPHVVADVGNTRIKWGRCAAGRVVEMASLPPDDAQAWQLQLARWPRTTNWALGGVHPSRRATLAAWLRRQGIEADEIESHRRLALEVAVEAPERVGLDRLFNAVAARARLATGKQAILVDAGSAVTVDWLDDQQVFRGGAIFPGLRLMAEALHRYTAQLPLIDVRDVVMPPGTSTQKAMMTGILHAAAGGIEKLTRRMGPAAHVFLTGGDAPLLAQVIEAPTEVWPEMTLEGIRITADC